MNFPSLIPRPTRAYRSELSCLSDTWDRTRWFASSRSAQRVTSRSIACQGGLGTSLELSLLLHSNSNCCYFIFTFCFCCKLKEASWINQGLPHILLEINHLLLNLSVSFTLRGFWNRQSGQGSSRSAGEFPIIVSVAQEIFASL